MNLSGLVKKAVQIADKQTKSLQEKVLQLTWVGQDGFGAPLPTVNVIRRAIVEQQLRNHKLPDGTEVKTKAKLTFLERIPRNGAEGRDEPVDPRDAFVLMDGTRGAVVDVQGMRNPDAGEPFLLEVYLGERQ